MNRPSLAQALVALYNQGGPYTAAVLGNLYTDDIRFTDPAHTVVGIDALASYLNHQYAPVTACTFTATGEWACGDTLFLQWDMVLRHPRLAGGNRITVNGLSQLQCHSCADGQTRIALHRDYFDLGQLLYENVPLLGSATRWLKRRLQA